MMRQSPADDIQEQRILVRGVNWLGDAVMTTPALQRLREARPTAHITLLTPAKLAELWTHHPSLDAVLPFGPGETVWQVARRLRVHRFTAALILPNSIRSALEPWLAGIPQRIGYANPLRSWLLTNAVAESPGFVPMRKRSVAEIKRLINSPTAVRLKFPPAAHHTFRYLHLSAALGARVEAVRPFVAVDASEVEAIKSRFGAGSQPLFGLNPGAEYGPAKRWPAERFVAAALSLQKQTGCEWWIFGAKADETLGSHIAGELGKAAAPSAVIKNLAGKTSLRELCAALRACQLLLTNDSGPMHLAAAVGTPVVVPFGSTSAELTGPGLPGHPGHALLQANVPCAPCFRRECPIDFRCMLSIKVPAVEAAAMNAFNNRSTTTTTPEER